MTHLNYQNTKYLKSAATLEGLPADRGLEVAFIGYSNAGKSSVLNTITKIKGLARISKAPGRTQMINFFAVSDHCRLVDLPGYGYAKVPRTIQQRWEHNINAYLKNRSCLSGLVLIMDIRHPLKELDWQLITWTQTCQLPLHILLTKSDKLSRQQARKTEESVKHALESVHKSGITIQLFSANDCLGLATVLDKLNNWFVQST